MDASLSQHLQHQKPGSLWREPSSVQPAKKYILAVSCQGTAWINIRIACCSHLTEAPLRSTCIRYVVSPTMRVTPSRTWQLHQHMMTQCSHEAATQQATHGSRDQAAPAGQQLEVEGTIVRELWPPLLVSHLMAQQGPRYALHAAQHGTAQLWQRRAQHSMAWYQNQFVKWSPLAGAKRWLQVQVPTMAAALRAIKYKVGYARQVHCTPLHSTPLKGQASILSLDMRQDHTSISHTGT